MTSSENFEKCSVRKMIRYTRPTHRLHPSQPQRYIVTSPEEHVLTVQKGTGGMVTIRGDAIDKLGQYEDIGTVEEVREAMEVMKRK